MPFDHQHQLAASAASARRSRQTTRLLRELSTCRPLTPEQRDQLIQAAAAIPVVSL